MHLNDCNNLVRDASLIVQFRAIKHYLFFFGRDASLMVMFSFYGCIVSVIIEPLSSVFDSTIQTEFVCGQ